MSGPGERRGLAAAAYGLIAAGGWLTVNALLAFGVLFVLFAMFANGSAAGFFAEAENLARHFGAASGEARAQFLLWVKVLAGAVFAAVCAARLPILAPVFGHSRRGARTPCPSQEGVWCDGR